MEKAGIEPRRFSDLRVMNWFQVFDHWVQEIRHERVFVYAAADYDWAEISFQHVEYLACPTYLSFNIQWRLASAEEAEAAFGAYVESDADRERARRECQVYCMDENLAVYTTPPQRAPHTFYIVAQSVEILLYYGGKFDDLGLL